LKDRCRAIWKNRETRKSSRRRQCGYQCPLAQCCSSRPDKTLSWVCSSSLQAARGARCEVHAADQTHYCCRPSALPCLLASPLRPSLSVHSAAESWTNAKLHLVYSFLATLRCARSTANAQRSVPLFIRKSFSSLLASATPIPQ
jgi:hypothetical protein